MKEKEINVYDLVASNKPLAEIMLAAAGMTETERQQASSQVSEEKLVELAMYAPFAVRATAAQFVLVAGCMIHLYVLATANAERRGLRKAFFNKLNISSSQAYRCLDVWMRLGPQLVREPKLRRAFTSAESLKLLSANSVPDAARNEALELARKGEVITTQAAETLIQKHTAQDRPQIPHVREEESKPRSVWSFIGSFVQIRIKPKSSCGSVDKATLIRDLEAALAALRDEPPPGLPSSATA